MSDRPIAPSSQARALAYLTDQIGLLWDAINDGRKPEVETAASLQAQADARYTLASPFAAYACVWSTLGTPPTLGNGTLDARFAQHDDVVIVQVQLTFGSTTSAGTNGWEFTLPVLMGGTQRFAAGVGQVIDNGVADYGCIVRADQSTNRVRLFTTGVPQQTFTNLIPHTWGTGDSVSWTLIFQGP